MQATANRYAKIEGSNKFEVVETDLGLRTTLSMNPKYIYIDQEYEIKKVPQPVQGGEMLMDKALYMPTSEQKRLIFDLTTMSLVSSEMLYERDVDGSYSSKKPLSVSRFYSPVYYNNKNNMLKLKYSHKIKLSVCSFVDYVSVMKFKNGDVYYNINEKVYAYNLKSEKVFLLKDDRFELKIRQGDGVTSLLKNGRLLMTDSGILDFFQSKVWDSWIYEHPLKEHEEMSVFKDLFEECFIGNSLDVAEKVTVNPEFLLTLYRVKRNKKLADLPWEDYKLTNLYGFSSKEFETTTYIDNVINNTYTFEGWLDDCSKQKRNALKNINRYLRNGNTKKATDACFYSFSFPKAVRSLLLQSRPLEFTKKSYELLYELCLKIGVNNTVDIISVDRKTLDKKPLQQPSLLQAYVDGFKKKDLNNIRKRENDLYWNDILSLADMYRMQNTLKREGINIQRTTKCYKRHHDNISRIYTAFVQAVSGAEAYAFRTVDTSKELKSMQVGDLLLRSPKVAIELVNVGDRMAHCVASYVGSYFYKLVDFLLILDKDGEYLACIEIKGKHIVQAKLKFNTSIKEDETIFNALKVWADKNGYTLSCYDCGTQQPTNLKAPQKDQSRVALVQEMTNNGDFKELQNTVTANDERVALNVRRNIENLFAPVNDSIPF